MILLESNSVAEVTQSSFENCVEEYDERVTHRWHQILFE